MDRLHLQRLGSILTLGVWVAVFLGAPRSGAVLGADMRRIRTIDPDLAALIQQGIEQSPTFERLADGVEQSDLIVHVERHTRFRPGESGSFTLVSARGGQRYARIALSSRLNPRELIVLLAHELQHANELATAPGVIDERGLREFYCSIGEIRQYGYDTVAAQRATQQVSAELAAHPDR